MDDDSSAALAERLIAVSELRGDFTLSSGQRSSVYFDKFRFLAEPGLLREVGAAAARLLPREATHLAAPEGAATLLVAAVALESDLPLAVVRREPKPYGTRSQVEGYAPAGAVAALIEDVSTTGGQALVAAKALERAGVSIGAIILALDRGGGDVLRRAGYDVRSVVSIRPTSDRRADPDEGA